MHGGEAVSKPVGDMPVLVDLKDGPRDSVYLREKPKAWQAARDLLAGSENDGGTPADQGGRGDVV